MKRGAVALLGLALCCAAQARDYSLVGTWALQNEETLQGIARTRVKTEGQMSLLRSLFSGRTLCTFTDTTWQCSSSGNPAHPGWARKGSYKLLSGDGKYKVAQFRVTEQKQSIVESPVQEGVALIQINGDQYLIYRPELDFWQRLKRVH